MKAEKRKCETIIYVGPTKLAIEEFNSNKNCIINLHGKSQNKDIKQAFIAKIQKKNSDLGFDIELISPKVFLVNGFYYQESYGLSSKLKFRHSYKKNYLQQTLKVSVVLRQIYVVHKLFMVR